jgi:hypothetical protein
VAIKRSVAFEDVVSGLAHRCSDVGGEHDPILLNASATRSCSILSSPGNIGRRPGVPERAKDRYGEPAHIPGARGTAAANTTYGGYRSQADTHLTLFQRLFSSTLLIDE